MRGFTLIEILIVVVILGIISSIIIPQFSSATREARESTLKDCLRYLREQIIVFKAQHRDVSPGYPNGDPTTTPDATTFVQQMTMASDERCNLAANPSSAFPYGPYLSQMPYNPLSGQNGILVVIGTTLPAADPSQPYGWIYCPQTQTIVANLTGNDSAGNPYSNY